MPLYTKPSVDMVYDLINQANPGLDNPVTKTNVKLGAPATTTVAGKPDLNTTIPISAVPGGDYIGNKKLNYRRLDLAKLTRSLLIQINMYSANQGAANSVVFTVYNLLSKINAKYGLNLTQDDVADANIVRGSTQENGYYTTTVTVTAKSTSLGYVGSFSLKWRGDAQDLSSMISVRELPARKFPGGNVFDGNHLTIVNNMAYNIDWSAFLSSGSVWLGYPNAINSNVGNEIVAFMGRFIAEINRVYGTNLQGGTNAAPAYAYSQWAMVVADLTTDAGKAAAPNANYAYYNRVLVITIPDASIAPGAGVGKYYIHYNV